jgi:TrmH family RNA methyltransferase
VIEGELLVNEAFAAGLEVEAVYVGPGGAVTAPPGVAVFEVGPGVVEAVATTVTPRAVLAVARRPVTRLDDLAARRPRGVVVCAGVADPGNAGTIVRVAEAAGMDGVVFTRGSVDPFNPKCVRASAGALFHVPVCVEVDPARLGALGVSLWGTAARSGTPYTDLPVEAPVGVVFGGEAHGIDAGMTGILTGVVSIPHEGRAESLNVAMAAAVICFDISRRRRSLEA